MLRGSLSALAHHTAPAAPPSLTLCVGASRSRAAVARSPRALDSVTLCQTSVVFVAQSGCPAHRGRQACTPVRATNQQRAHREWSGCWRTHNTSGSRAEPAVPTGGRPDLSGVLTRGMARHDVGLRSSGPADNDPQPRPWTDSLRIAPGEVHVWWLHPDKAAADPELLAQYEALLSPGEALQLAAAPSDALRGERLLARTLTRTVLGRYCHPVCGPSALQFQRNTSGKPSLTWPAALEHCDGAALHFNLSHTGGLMGLAVALGVDVGLDVEALDRAVRSEPLRLARRRFSPAEAAILEALHDPAERQRRFMKLWTLKEAYLKAVGHGISKHPGLAGFTVDPRPSASIMGSSGAGSADQPTETNSDTQRRVSREEVVFMPPAGESASDWRFELLQPTPRHVAGVCVRTQNRTEWCGEDSILHVHSREVLPLVWDRELDPKHGMSVCDGAVAMSKL